LVQTFLTLSILFQQNSKNYTVLNVHPKLPPREEENRYQALDIYIDNIKLNIE